MPRHKPIPKYGLHKPSGQARVLINGQHIYLGPYRAAESREKYLRLVAEASRPGRDAPSLISPQTPASNLSINELILRYMEFARSYYMKDGKPAKENDNIKHSAHPLRALYSHTPASEFGPKRLQAVRQHMIDTQKLSRGVINSRINRIRRIFKWAVAEELVPPSVYEGLRAVAGLRYGRTEARETEPVRPVDDAVVNATLPHLPPQIADMVRLQRLTGMRPGDVCLVRPCDINTTGEVWVYEPSDHKTKYRGHRRLIPLGPRAQEIAKKYLSRSVTSFLFSPREAMESRRQGRRNEPSSRKTPVYPCERLRLERERKERRRRKQMQKLCDHYTTNTYHRAVSYGIEKARKAGVALAGWFPNQLRHARATEVRKAHGLEAAQVVLGHARADVTQVYAERNLELAATIAKNTG